MLFVILIVGFFGVRYISRYEKENIPADDFSLYEGEVTWRGVTYGTIPAKLAEQSFTLAIAADQQRRRLGLSEVEELPEGYGMIFAFPTEMPHGFWMKQMRFPLDIIWLNNEKEIVKVLTDVAPETYPTTFGAEVDSRFVIELNAGSAEKYGIKFGQTVEFELPFE